MKFRNVYDRKPYKGVSCKGGLTHQSFREECDINFIMRRAAKTGMLPPATRIARFGDFSDVKSYQMSLDIVMQANDMFSALPAAIRDRFKNDPAELLAFVGNKANLDEAVKLGLVELKPIKSEVPPSKEVPPKGADAPPSK